MSHDNAFEMAVSSIRFGKGVTREVGMDLAELGAKHVLVVTDATLRALPPVHIPHLGIVASGGKGWNAH